MAIKIKTKATVSTRDLMKEFQSEWGESIGSFGGAKVNAQRVPTGIFELDLALGGGFPRGKVSEVFGPESSTKTNTVLLAIAQHQKLWPDLTCTFVDVEHSFDPDWATALGVDVDKLAVFRPAYAEQAVDMVESLLMAEDGGLVVIDSLAALVTTSEIESSADKAQVGGAAITIGKLTRKTTRALQEAEKEGRFPTLIYINQITFKVGVMFGNPETTPGGTKPKHQASIRLRLYGKNVTDAKVSKTMPVIKHVTFIVAKWKCPILSASGEYDLLMAHYKGLRPGQSDDFSAIKGYLESYGFFEKGPNNKGWKILGDEYPTIEAFKQRLYGDPVFGNEVRQAIVERCLKDNDLLMEGGEK